MTRTCECTHNVGDHRIVADKDGPVGSCKLCGCKCYKHSGDTYIPAYTHTRIHPKEK